MCSIPLKPLARGPPPVYSSPTVTIPACLSVQIQPVLIDHLRAYLLYEDHCNHPGHSWFIPLSGPTY